MTKSSAKKAATQPILIIEDSDVDFMAIHRALKRAGCESPVQRCQSGDEAARLLGLEACKKAKNQIPQITPALVLLDLNMPGLNGLELLRLIKTSKHKSYPVVVMTSSADPKDIQNCYQAGANSYVQKPIAFEELYDIAGSLKEYWFQTTMLPANS